MHFKYVIIIIGLLIAMPAQALLDVGQLVKSAQNRNDTQAAAALVDKLQELPVNKQVTINPAKLAPQPEDTGGNIADGKGVDTGKLLSRYYPQFQEGASKAQKLNQLLIFISLSIPEESLIALSSQAKKAGGLLVLRGLVNNSFKETASALRGLDVVIDPRLFDAFAVDIVPTFIVTPTDTNPCADNKCKFTPIHDRISGNVSLEYALGQISSGGKVSNAVASAYLIKLRENHD